MNIDDYIQNDPGITELKDENADGEPLFRISRTAIERLVERACLAGWVTAQRR